MIMPDNVAIVRSAEEHDQEQDYTYWHEQAVQASKVVSSSNLKHAEALYEIKELKGYKKMGHDTMGEYVYKYFNRSSKWAEKLISIHKKFVVELNRDIKELEEVTFGKLAILVSIVDEENVEQLLVESKDMTQGDIAKRIKQEKGLAENETQVDNETGRLSFTAPIEAIDSIKAALDEARDEYAQVAECMVDEVKPFQALELMAANFLNTFDRENNDYEVTLHRALKRIEAVYKIDISYVEREQE